LGKNVTKENLIRGFGVLELRIEAFSNKSYRSSPNKVGELYALIVDPITISTSRGACDPIVDYFPRYQAKATVRFSMFIPEARLRSCKATIMRNICFTEERALAKLCVWAQRLPTGVCLTVTGAIGAT